MTAVDRWRDRRPLNPCRRTSDRGATLVEYGLGVALVCVVSLGAIGFLEDESEKELNDRSARVGAPDLEEGLGSGGGTTGGTTGGSTGGSDGTTPAAPSTLSVTGLSSSGTRTGNDWDATVGFDTFGDGAALDGIEVSGTWTLYIGGVAQAPEVINPPCVTSAANDGSCTFTRDDMEHRTNKPYVEKVVFTVTGYRYVNSDPATVYTIPPAPALTVEIVRPA